MTITPTETYQLKPNTNYIFRISNLTDGAIRYSIQSLLFQLP